MAYEEIMRVLKETIASLAFENAGIEPENIELAKALYLMQAIRYPEFFAPYVQSRFADYRRDKLLPDSDSWKESENLQAQFLDKYYSAISLCENDLQRMAVVDLALSALRGGACVIWPPNMEAEIERNMKAQISSKAGKHSAEKRRQNAANGWKAHALELAITTLSEKPCLSQANLAAEIYASWKKEVPKCPSHSTLLGYVAQLQKDKKINLKKICN